VARSNINLQWRCDVSNINLSFGTSNGVQAVQARATYIANGQLYSGSNVRFQM
jgi:hypothetical protein